MARGQLPVGRADLPARQPAAARAAGARARQAAAARPLGHDPGPELHLRPPQPGDPRARPQRDLRRPAPGTAAPGSSPTPTSRAPTARSTRTSVATRRGCGGCSASSPSPAGSRATSRPETPGSIHEGGELGYALVHAYGAAFDNPDLLVVLRRRRRRGGDRAARRPAGTRTSSSNPARDGAVLPILHLNGYKIANPTVLARIPHERAARAARGLRLRPTLRRGRRPAAMHQLMAAALDACRRRDRRDPARSARPAAIASGRAGR